MLEVEGLVSAYGRIEVLHSVSLTVAKGEIVALVGANGAGKTTLLRALSGVQPLRGGAIHFRGERLDSVPAHRRAGLGLVQVPEGRHVFNPLSVEDNLLLGAYSRRDRPTPEDLDAIYALFPILKDKRHLQAAGLSGGQQQMLAIGRALMARPTLLLLDEPSMGLAPVIVELIFGIIRQLAAEGMTILLVEQNAFAALAMAHRGYVLETGRITMSGTGQQLLHDPAIRAAYLGV